MQVRPLDGEDPLEEGMATHSSNLAWRIQWTEKPGRLESMGSQNWTLLKGVSMHINTVIKLSIALLVPDVVYCTMAEKQVLSSPLCVVGSWGAS